MFTSPPTGNAPTSASTSGSSGIGFSSSLPFQFAPPSKFSGKREDFEEFSFTLKAYLNLMEGTFGSTMLQAEETENDITDDFFRNPDGSFNDKLAQMATSLQFLLVTLCTGSASAFIRRDMSPNGFESWRRLHRRYVLPSRVKALGRLSTILEGSFKMDNFEDSLASWEEEINKYEKETSTPLAHDTKICVLMNKTKGRL